MPTALERYLYNIQQSAGEREEGEQTQEPDRHALAKLPASELPSALYTAAKGGVSSFLGKTPKDMALSVLAAPYTVAKSVAKNVYEDVKEVAQDPRQGVDTALGIAGATAGALTGNPALAIAGGVAGRAAGEALESWMFNRPILNAESALEVAVSGFGNMSGQLLGGAIRGKLRSAGKSLAAPALAPTVIDRPRTEIPPTPESIQLYLRQQQATANMRSRVSQMYKDIELKGKTAPVYSFPDVTGKETITDRIKEAQVQKGIDFTSAAREVLEVELNQRRALSEADRIARWGASLGRQDLQIEAEIGRIDRRNLGPQPGGKLKPTLLQRRVEAGLRAPQEEAEFLRRTNQNLLKNIPDYLQYEVDTFRNVTDTLPEATKHPLVQAVGKIAGSGVTNSLWRTQSWLRKDKDPHLTGVANILVSADETYKQFEPYFAKISKDLFETSKLSDTDKVYLQKLENNADLYLAMRDIDKTLPEAQQLAILKAALPGERIAMSELKDLHKNTEVIAQWQKNIGDPIMQIANTLARDARTIPPFRPSYFTSTFVYENEIDRLRAQMAQMEELAQSTAGPLAERYVESAAILKQKIAIGMKAMEKKAQTVNTWRQLTALTGVVPKEVFAPALTSKKTLMGIGLDPEKASISYIQNTLKKVIYDRALQTGDETVRDWVKTQVALGKNPDSVHAIARSVQNVLMDQVGTRASVQMEKIKDVLDKSPVTQGIGKHLMTSLKNITTFHYLANIAAKPTFYPMNLMQNFLTLMPLVDTESFAHGIAQGIVNYKQAFKEAQEAGALQEGLNKLWREDPLQVGAGRLDVVAEKAGLFKPAEMTENWNRVVAFHAGKRNAELAGLKGQDAIKKALDVVAETNFMYSAAHRPSAFNTPLGSTLLRYRSFSHNYGSFVANLARKGEKAKLGAALAAVFATSGTAGMPLYQWTRERAAELGVVLPEVNPFEEVMGIELGGGTAPWPILPTSLDEASGPILGMAAQGLKTVTGQGESESNIATLGRMVGGAPLQRVIAGAAEFQRGGLTVNASGKEAIARRSPEQIAKSALGLAPSIRGEQYRTRQNLGIAVKAGDREKIREEVLRSRAAGLVNQRQILQSTRANITKDKNRTALGEYIGYGVGRR